MGEALRHMIPVPPVFEDPPEHLSRKERKEWYRQGGDAYPKFFIAGKALSESGGDHHTVIYNAKATQISGTHQDQEFWISNAEGTGIASINEDSQGADGGKVWSMVSNETAVDIALPA